MQLTRILAAATVGLALAGCGGGDQQAAASTPGQPPAAPAAGPRVTLGRPVAPTGTVHDIRMVTDEKGNSFEPAAITARKGDVLRFVLISGVHNVHFPAETNAGVQGLPAAGELLQVPGQAYELTVGVDAGTYAFQCDPHAALGMVGTLTVE